MIPLWLAAEVTKELANRGFANGLYGDLPYRLIWPEDFKGRVLDVVSVWLAGRRVGSVWISNEGIQLVFLDMAGWLSGSKHLLYVDAHLDPVMLFPKVKEGKMIIAADYAQIESKMIVYYAKHFTKEIAQVLIQNKEVI